jgi:hypothetical protein
MDPRGKASGSEIVTVESLTEVLLPISRLMLESGVGVNQLLRAAKHAYVKAAIAEVLPPGSRVNISRLSVATGLTRKDVTSVVKYFSGTRPQSASRTKEQRALRVLRGWITDPRFHDQRGRPAELPPRGESSSFQRLVRLYAGDVTPAAVLRELERMRAVSTTRANTLRLRVRRRTSTGHWVQRAADLARLFGDFAGTVSGPRTSDETPVFFGFRECDGLSPDEIARFQRDFAKRGAALLEGFEHWLASRDRAIDSSGGRRVGVGVYLVKGEPRPRKRRHSADT